MSDAEVLLTQPTRLIQLTDSHLLSHPDALFRGVNPQQNLRLVVAEVIRKHGLSDVLLATGDLAQDSSEQAYAAFLKLTQGVANDSIWVPGNHDEAAHMQGWPATLNRSWLDVPGWRLVFLDSTVPGQNYGELNALQWQYFESALATVGARQVLVVMHHHLVPCGSAWMDRLMVRDADTVRQRLQRYPSIKMVLCGHIHQSLEHVEAGIHYLATPATSVQFLPQQAQFALDIRPPGYRWLHLWPDGSLLSQVDYLEEPAPATIGNERSS